MFLLNFYADGIIILLLLSILFQYISIKTLKTSIEGLIEPIHQIETELKTHKSESVAHKPWKSYKYKHLQRNRIDSMSEEELRKVADELEQEAAV
jgi:predicted Holliday junction resolvase-like endonuclease